MSRWRELPASWNIGFGLFVANLVLALVDRSPWNTIVAVGLAAALTHEWASR